MPALCYFAVVVILTWSGGAATTVLQRRSEDCAAACAAASAVSCAACCTVQWGSNSAAYRTCVAPATLLRRTNATNSSGSAAPATDDTPELWILISSGLVAAGCVGGIVWNCLRKQAKAVVAAGSEGNWAEMSAQTKWYDVDADQAPPTREVEEGDRVYPITRQDQVNV